MLKTPLRDTDLQRSAGSLHLDIGAGGTVLRLREEGCSKIRSPARQKAEPYQAIMINTSGGLAGGDRLSVEANVEDGGSLCLTTQAAERIYRSLGSETSIDVRLRARVQSEVMWLPQEAILFDGARLQRVMDIELDADCNFVAVETIVLGRKAMGETLNDFSLHDRWRIRRDDRLIYADDLRFDPSRMKGLASLGEAGATAGIICVGEKYLRLVEPLREIIGQTGGVSAWDGKLIARLMANDSFYLRKALIPALRLLVAPMELPKVWTS